VLKRSAAAVWGLLFLGGILLGSACVPLKKKVLLQDDSGQLTGFATDSLYKSYQNDLYQYKLQYEDVLSIQITPLVPTDVAVADPTNEQQPSTSLLSGYRIDRNGNVTLPSIGTVNLQGLTLEQAQDTITVRAMRTMLSPIVRVNILNFYYTVLGEVGSPGRYSSLSPRVNILEALGQAGDLTEYANRSNIKLLRQEQGRSKIIYLNVLKEDLLQSPYYYLRPNDIITVAPLRVKNTRSYSLANYGLVLSTLTALAIMYTQLIR